MHLTLESLARTERHRPPKNIWTLVSPSAAPMPKPQTRTISQSEISCLHMVIMQRNTPLHGCIVRPRKNAGKHMCSAIDTPCQPAVIAQPKHHCTEPSLHDAIFVAFLVRLLLTTSLSAECYLRVNCRMRCRAMTNPMLWVAPKTATNCDPTHSRADLHCQHYPFLSTRVRLTPHRCLPCIQLACTCMLAAACSCCFSAAASAAAYAFAAALLSASASAAAIAAYRTSWHQR